MTDVAFILVNGAAAADEMVANIDALGNAARFNAGGLARVQRIEGSWRLICFCPDHLEEVPDWLADKMKTAQEVRAIQMPDGSSKWFDER